MSAEELAKQAADRVHEIVAEAERRAAEIVREAEAEAQQIRERARAETPQPPAPTPDPTPSPGPPAPDPQPPTPTPSPEPPAPGPQMGSQNGAGGDAAARLTAMKLAIDGKDREEIAAELEARFGAGDRAALLDDVLARAGKKAPSQP